MLSDRELARIAAEEGIQPEQLLAIFDKEGSPSDNTVAKVAAANGERAYGRAQILPATFRQKMPDGDITSPEDNARAAARYIKEGLDKNGGDFRSAAAFYFAGPAWKSKNQDKDYGGITINNYADQAVKHLEKRQGANSMSPDEISGDITIDLGGGSSADSDITGRTASGKMRDLTALADSQAGDIIQSGNTVRDKIKANLKSQIESITKQGELAATVKLEEFQQQSKKASENAAELSRLGLNLSDVDSLLATTSVTMVEDIKQARAMRAEIDAKRNVGLFDSPIEYIINQFSLPGQIKEHNSIIQKVASQRNNIDELSKVAKEAAGSNALKYTAISLDGARASADLEREKAHEKVLEIDDKLAKVDLSVQKQAFDVTQARLASLRAQQESELREGQRRTVNELKDAETQRKKLDDQAVSIAATMLGYNVPDRKTLDKSPKAMKEAIEAVMMNGGVGTEPLQAQQVLARGDTSGMAGATLYQRGVLNDIRKQAETNLGSGKNAPLLANASKAQRQEALSAEMNKLANQYADNPNFSLRPSLDNGAVNNPYHIPPPSVMNKIPEARKLPLAKIIEESKVALPNVAQTDSIILELAYANIGKVYPDINAAAKDVAKYYQTGIAFNNEKMVFNHFGLREQQEYKVGTVDLTSPASILRMYISKDKRAIMDETFNKTVNQSTKDTIKGERAAEARRNLDPIALEQLGGPVD